MLSTPPTTAASISPAAISRAALPKTLALDEQAVDTTQAGPSSCSARATKSATEKVFWVGPYLKSAGSAPSGPRWR